MHADGSDGDSDGGSSSDDEGAGTETESEAETDDETWEARKRGEWCEEPDGEIDPWRDKGWGGWPGG